MTLLDDRPVTRSSFAAALVLSLREHDLISLSGNVIRRVKTAEGAKLFGQPIGTIITKDMLHPLVGTLKQLNDFPVGTKVVHDKGKGKEVVYTKKQGGYWESSATKKYGVAGALSPLIVTNQLRVRNLPGEDLEGGDDGETNTDGKASPKNTDAVAPKIGFNPTLHDAANKKRDPDFVEMSDEDLSKAIKKTEENLVKAKKRAEAGEQTYGAEKEFAKKADKLRTEEGFRKTDQQYNGGKYSGGKKEAAPAKAAPPAAVATPTKAPTPAPEAPTPAPEAPTPAPTKAPDAVPTPAQAPSQPQGEKVSDVAGLDALPTGAQISFKSNAGDVRTYSKEADGRWSGPSGYHDAADFTDGLKGGRVTKLAPGAAEPVPEAPAELKVQSPPEADVKTLDEITKQAQENADANIGNYEGNKKKLTDYPVGTKVHIGKATYEKKEATNKKGVSGEYWESEGENPNKSSSGSLATGPHTVVSSEKAAEPDPESYFDAAPKAPVASTQSSEGQKPKVESSADIKSDDDGMIGFEPNSPAELDSAPVGTVLKAKTGASNLTKQSNQKWKTASGSEFPSTDLKLDNLTYESMGGSESDSASKPVTSPEDDRWQLGPLLTAGTTGKGKKALADALKAASGKTQDKNDAAALETAAGVLTSPNWATYGGPEKHGAQLAKILDNTSVLDTAGLTKADVDARVKALSDLADYLDKTSGDYNLPYGSIEVATVFGKTSPTIADYLSRFVNGYKDAKAKQRTDAKEKIEADKAKAAAKEEAYKAKQAEQDKADAEAAKVAADESALKELNSQLPEDKAFIDKPADEPYTAAEIMNAPIGSKVTVKNSFTGDVKTFTKHSESDYWSHDDSLDSFHMPSEAEAGKVFNFDESARDQTPELIGVDKSGHKSITVNGKKISLTTGDIPYVSDGTYGMPGMIYVKMTNDGDEWMQYAPDGFETELGQNLHLDTQVALGKLVEMGKQPTQGSMADNDPDVQEVLSKLGVPGVGPNTAPVPNALKLVQFEVQGIPFQAPPGTKLYASEMPDDLPDIIAVHPDGEIYLHGSVNGHVVALKQDLTSAKIVQKLIDKGSFIEKTDDMSAPTKLHPSGLKPGKYSKGPNAKVYMLVNEDGTAMYVDKAGNAKVLGTKGVLGNHAAGMQYYSQFTGVLPVPGKPADADSVSFKALNGKKTFTVPAGSKVYHNNLNINDPENALVKFVQYPDGSWAKIDVDKQELIDIEPEMALDEKDLSSGTYVLDTSVTTGPIKKTPAVKKIKATGPSFEADESGYVPNPFSSPPSFSYKTSELSAEIARLVDESGFKGVAGLNRGQMTPDQKKRWLTAWYAGDFETAFNIELAAAVKKDENTKVKDIQELVDAPLGTRIVSVEYGDPNTWMKTDGDTWSREGSSQTRTTQMFEYKIGGYSSSVHLLSKAVHTKAAKHPGSPDYPGNAVTINKVQFGAVVAGELPAGVMPKGGEGTGLTADLNEFSNDNPSSWTVEQVDAYLLAAGMSNSQGLKQHEKTNWVAYHWRGKKIETDRMSVQAKNNTDKGVFYSEQITPPAPVLPAGESVPDFVPAKPFTIEASHANNLTVEEIDAYLTPLFTKKAGAAIKKQPEDVKRAIVQLHWLSTQPPTKNAHKTPLGAKAEFTNLAASVETQMAPKVADYNGNLDYAIALPEFEVKTVWKKAPKDEQPNYKGAFEKYDVKDDSGNVLFFKPGKSDWRVRIADAANKMGALFGFKTPASQLLTVDGVEGQAQKKVPNNGSTKGFRPEDLTEKQLMDLFREHVLDWTIDQDDAHDDQFLMTPDGGLVGIDKDRAFASQSTGHTGNKLERGKLSTNPAVVEKSYYEDLYKAAATGKISPEILQKAYKQVIARANTMQNVNDEKYRELLEYAFEKNPKMSAAQREKQIQTALARKNSLVADFDKFWTDLLADAGVEKPEPGKVSDSPGLHAGFTPELIEDVKKSRNWGHASFFASSDLEDGHVLLWEEKGANGKPAVLNGQGLLLKDGDAKFEAWLATNYKGPNTVSTPIDNKTLPDLETYSSTVKTGVITIAKHLQDGQYNQGSIQKMLDLKTTLEDHLSSGQPLPNHKFADEPKKKAAFDEMAAEYIKAIDAALAAKENGVKPEQFAPYNYVWQPEDKDPGGVAAQIALAPQFKVTKRYAAQNVATLDTKTNLLTDTGTTETTGQSGQEYLIEFPDGSQITYRPWGQGANLSQQGQLKFRVPEYGDNPSQGDKIMNFLRDEVGIEAGDATDESLELQYWRTYYGTMSKRYDAGSGKQGKVKQAVSENDPRKLKDPTEELNRWREIMAEMTNPDQIAKFVEDKGYLPQFGKTTIEDKDGVHGRPFWNRFDVDLNKLRMSGKLLARSQRGLRGGNYPSADDSILLALRSGGVIPIEERNRLIGYNKEGSHGGSGNTDAERGSASFTMIRQNISSSSEYHIYFDPAMMGRVSSYAYGGDEFGNIAYKGKMSGKGSTAHWDISSQMGHSGYSNEGVIKGGMNILNDAVLVVFSSPTKRQTAIDEYRALGIEDINGTPLEEFFVLNSNRQAAYKNAQARLKARVLGSGYDPSLASFADTGKSGNSLTPPEPVSEETILDAPEDFKFVGKDGAVYTKLGPGQYVKSLEGQFAHVPVGGNAVSHLANSGEFVTYSEQQYNIGKTPTSASINNAPVGAKLQGTIDSTFVYEKINASQWKSVKDGKIGSQETLASSSDTKLAQFKWSSWPIASASTATESSMVSSAIDKDSVETAPLGAKFTWENSYGDQYEYTKTGDNEWTNQDGDLYGSTSAVVDNKLDGGATWVVWPQPGEMQPNEKITSESQLTSMAVGSVIKISAGVKYTFKGGDLWQSDSGSNYSTKQLADAYIQAGSLSFASSPKAAPITAPTGPVSTAGLLSAPTGSKVVTGSGTVLTKSSGPGSMIYHSSATGYDVELAELGLDASDFVDWNWEGVSSEGMTTASPGKLTTTEELDTLPIGSIIQKLNGAQKKYTKIDNPEYPDSIWQTEDGATFQSSYMSGSTEQGDIQTLYIGQPEISSSGKIQTMTELAKVGDSVSSYTVANEQPVGTEIKVSTDYGSSTIYKSEDGLWYNYDEEDHTPIDGEDWQHMVDNNTLTYSVVPGPAQPKEEIKPLSGYLKSAEQMNAARPGTQFVSVNYASESYTKQPDGGWLSTQTGEIVQPPFIDKNGFSNYAWIVPKEPEVNALDKKWNTSGGFIPESETTATADALGAGSKILFEFNNLHGGSGTETSEYEKQANGKWMMTNFTGSKVLGEAEEFDSSGFAYVQKLKVIYDANSPFLSLFQIDPEAAKNAEDGKDSQGNTLLHSSNELNELAVGAKIKATGGDIFVKQPDETWADETGWKYTASDFSLSISDGGYWKLPEAEWEAPKPAPTGAQTVKTTNDLAVLPEGTQVVVSFDGKDTTYTKMPNGNWFSPGDTGLTGIGTYDAVFKDALNPYEGGSVKTIPKSEIHQTGPVGTLMDLKNAPVGTRIKKNYGASGMRTFVKKADGTWMKEGLNGSVFQSDSTVLGGSLGSLEWTDKAVVPEVELTNADYDFVKIMAGVR